MDLGERHDMTPAARIRRALRERLMAERTDGVWLILGAFGVLAELQPELAPEVDRWRSRFEMLAVDESPRLSLGA
jgi:hypothetical protein